MAGASDKEIKKLIDIIKGIRTGILVTNNGSHLKGRPIQIAGVDDDGIIWFYTYERSGRIDEMEIDNKVFLSFSEPGTDVYAVVSARAYEEEDLHKLSTLQNPALRSLLPNGACAKHIIVFRAEPLEAEFWDGRSGRIIILFRMLTKLLTGEQAGTEQHVKIDRWNYSN